jgi:hypothetical protein
VVLSKGRFGQLVETLPGRRQRRLAGEPCDPDDRAEHVYARSSPVQGAEIRAVCPDAGASTCRTRTGSRSSCIGACE